ncbi:HEPN domain-containing protein [Mucilaginibacter gracilis]|uniref:HEPN domain-containing protein n=2 Tax=Mucilaginibacter gracilis TaxID=423350 RepID=A0A495IYN9_9SPHI|nr:HEPN domain-containing protein [Mucilaginibacter gracilis]
MMYIGPYTPWEHYPKLLRYDEVQHPIDVLEDFFSVSDLDGHRRLLKEWRDFVISEKYYAHKRFGPGSLLFTHEVNLKLLEAAYLLLLNHEHHWPRSEPLTDEALTEEKADWDEQPASLSHKELLNPYKAIKKVFKHYSLPAYRDHLGEWLSFALSIKTNEEEIRAHEFIPVYEKLLKLYDAAWLIHIRSKLKKRQSPKTIAANPEVPQVTIKAIAPTLSAAEQLRLNEVITLITERMTSVKSITLLGIHPTPFTYYLLILIDDKHSIAEHVAANKVEDLCRQLVSLITIVHKVSVARQGLNNGRRFWNNIMSSGIEVYRAPEFSLPEYQPVTKEVFVNRAKVDWERWGTQGKAFFQGAKRYIEEENYTLGIFLLHQAAESTLIGLIRVLMGYRISAHNLSRMLRTTLLFTDALQDIFELGSDEGQRLFKLLQEAYAEARYRTIYMVEEEDVKQLVPKVELFLNTAQAVFDGFVKNGN